MKQYKLIKDYPSLPPNWKIGMIVQLRNLHYLPVELFYDDKGIPYIEVEDYPEFWELVKVKEVLFITKDNVEIYEGDTYYYIWINLTADNEEKFIIYKTENAILKKNEKWSEDALFFSTKEAAEEYIIMNKPCLSIKDIQEVYPSSNNKKYPHLERLINLVKSKT